MYMHKPYTHYTYIYIYMFIVCVYIYNVVKQKINHPSNHPLNDQHPGMVGKFLG